MYIFVYVCLSVCLSIVECNLVCPSGVAVDVCDVISRRRTLSRSGSPSRSGTYTGTPSRWTPLEKHTAKEKYPKVLREVFPNVLNVVMSNKSLIRLNTSGCRRLKSCQCYTYAYQNLLGHVFNHPRSNNWSRSPNDRPIGVGFEAG